MSVLEAIQEAMQRLEDWIPVGADGHALRARLDPRRRCLVFSMHWPRTDTCAARVMPFGVHLLAAL